jgi:hypothetical protein
VAVGAFVLPALVKLAAPVDQVAQAQGPVQAGAVPAVPATALGLTIALCAAAAVAVVALAERLEAVRTRKTR